MVVDLEQCWWTEVSDPSSFKSLDEVIRLFRVDDPCGHELCGSVDHAEDWNCLWLMSIVKPW